MIGKDVPMGEASVVKIKIGDIVVDGRIRNRVIVVRPRIGRPVQSELLGPARGSIPVWLEQRGGTLDDPVGPNRVDHAIRMSIRQHARLMGKSVTGVGLQHEDYGTHSLRRTKASINYKQTGNLRAVQIILGHM